MRGYSAFIATAIAVVAVPAMAKQSAPVPQLQPSLRIGVVGKVPVDCSLTQSVKGVEIEDFEDSITDKARPAKATLPFNVSCNTPIKVTLASKSGGLRFQGASTSDTDFTSLVAYSANLVLPGRRSALACASKDMVDEGTGCTGRISDALIDGDGAIQITLTPDGGLLQQGDYTDRVTITISPLLGSDT